MQNKSIVVAFGRMNPITSGHEKLVDKVKATARARKADAKIYLSHSQDAKKNPLSYDQKIAYGKKAFGSVIAKSDARTVIEALKELDGKYDTVYYVAGGDRIEEFGKLLNKYNGKNYNFKSIEIVSAGERDPDADDVSGMSASKLRGLAKEGDFDQFKMGLPKRLQSDAKTVYDTIRSQMKISEEEEHKHVKLDPEDAHKHSASFRRGHYTSGIHHMVNQKVGKWEVMDDKTGVIKGFKQKGKYVDMDTAKAHMDRMKEAGLEESTYLDSVKKKVKKDPSDVLNATDAYTADQDDPDARKKESDYTDWNKKIQDILLKIKEEKDLDEDMTPAWLKSVSASTVSRKKYQAASTILKKIVDRKRKENDGNLRHGIEYYAAQVAKQISPSIDAKILARMVKEGTTMEQDIQEVLDIKQRLKRRQIMRRLKARIKRGRAIAKRKLAPTEKLKVRAQKQARNIIRSRMTGGKDYKTLATGAKIAVDKRVESKKAMIAKMAKRLLPKVRKAEMRRLAKARGATSQSETKESVYDNRQILEWVDIALHQIENEG